MNPNLNTSSQQLKLLSNLERFGIEGADSSLSPSAVAAALRGGLGNSLLEQQALQQLGLGSGFDLRSSILSSHVQAPLNPLLSSLVERPTDALREALLARHRLLSNPLESLAISASVPRLSLTDSVQHSLALAQTAQQDAIVNEAFQRGKEEALMSLLRSGAMPRAAPKLKKAPASAAKEVMNQLAGLDLLASKDTNAVALEALGATGMERRKTNAPYFDASSLADPDPVTLANRRTRGGVTEPFPEKLHRMLIDAERGGEDEVVSWFGHGRAFAIHHVERFCREVMPRYFKQSRLSSFQRQLNLYGFTRITSGPDTGGYYHELFLKGRPALVIHMRRVGVPKSQQGSNAAVRPPINPPAAPDFYAMTPVKPREED